VATLPQKELFKLESTRGDMVIPVDYNDVGAVDPGPDDVFWSQMVVDRFLAANSATNFKHIAAVWEAFPDVIKHDITFNLAAGIHRPRPTDTVSAWPLNSKEVAGAITINGASPSSWTLVDPSLEDLAIDTVQSGSGNPYVSFTGTPLFGFDLKGWLAVFDTGQVSPIHLHDDSTLYITGEISPTPSTVSVMYPSTILRNSIDDATKVANNYGLEISANKRSSDFSSSIIYINYATVDPFGEYNAIYGAEGFHYWTNIVVRRDTGPTEDGGSFSTFGAYGAYAIGCTQRAFTSATDTAAGFYDTYFAGLIGSYFRGGQDGVSFSNVTLAAFQTTVLDDVSDAVGDAVGWASLVLRDVREIEFSEYNEGKRNEIRAGGNSIAGLRFERAALRPFFGSRILFKDVQGPCVEIYPHTRVVVEGNCIGSSNPAGFIDAGGNGDVGIELKGSYAYCKLESGTDAAGTNGDVRLKGDEIVDYTTIETDGPLTDEGLNVIEKV
jgi:hypothetical protein